MPIKSNISMFHTVAQQLLLGSPQAGQKRIMIPIICPLQQGFRSTLLLNQEVVYSQHDQWPLEGLSFNPFLKPSKLLIVTTSCGKKFHRLWRYYVEIIQDSHCCVTTLLKTELHVAQNSATWKFDYIAWWSYHCLETLNIRRLTSE